VEQVVIVKPMPDKPTLNTDTILFMDRGYRALGKILDVYGHVNEPYYCIRFNDSEHIQKSNLEVDMTVYYCPSTSYIYIYVLHAVLNLNFISLVE